MSGAGLTVWLTGLPASGKTTLGDALADHFFQRGLPVSRLDGDVLRRGLNADLGFSRGDRAEASRRVGELALACAAAGEIAIVSLVSPYAADRNAARAAHESAGVRFLEVFLATPLEECERRDPRGLYARARRGEISGMTGIDDPYEPPLNAELKLHPQRESVDECLSRMLLVCGIPSDI